MKFEANSRRLETKTDFKVRITEFYRVKKKGGGGKIIFNTSSKLSNDHLEI